MPLVLHTETIGRNGALVLVQKQVGYLYSNGVVEYESDSEYALMPVI